MKTIRISLVAMALCAVGSASAADPATTDAARAQYGAERARCMSGTTGQDQASCLRSAGAAYESIKQGRLRDENTAYRENAVARCRALPAPDKADCESRVGGGGDGMTSGSGSVKGGGIIKETVTTTVGPTTDTPLPPVLPPAAIPAPPSASGPQLPVPPVPTVPAAPPIRSN